MNANELRIGNLLKDNLTGNYLKVCDLLKDKITTTVIDRSKYPLPDGWQAIPIPLSPEILENAGFTQLPHFTVQNIWKIALGRDRILTVADVGTPNEMVFISEEQPPHVTALIVARNYDYDGKTYLHQLQNLYFALTGTEINIQL